MRKSRFSETQIVGILRDAESGVPVPDLLSPLVVTTQGLEEFRSHRWLKHLAYLPFRRGMVTVARASAAVPPSSRRITLSRKSSNSTSGARLRVRW